MATRLPPLPPLPLLRTFEAAARQLSFKRAAEELHVTPAAVSQQMRSLEAQLGQPLFLRLTRALRLTEAGAALAPEVTRALQQLAEAVQRVNALADRPGGRLTVIAPPSFASHWLLPRLPGFHAGHPGIELRLASSSDSVDPRGDAAALAALGAAGRSERDADASVVAILYGREPAATTGLHVERLLTPELLPVCAPGWLAAHPLTRPAELCRQPLIHAEVHGRVNRAGIPWGWPQWLRAAGVRSPLSPTAGGHFANVLLAIEAALAGQGVALAPRPMIAALLDSGALVAPFGLGLPSPSSYWLVAREDVARRPAVRAFQAWVNAEASGDSTTGADQVGPT